MNFVDAKNISLGGKAVKKITTPDGKLVWPFPKLSLQWIKSSGTQYIDTGIIPTLDYSVEVKAIKATNYSLFGSGKFNYVCTGDKGENYFYIGQGVGISSSDPKAWDNQCYNYRCKVTVNGLNSVHVWKISGRKGYCDESESAQSTYDGTLTDKLYLFCRNLGGSANDFGSHTLYYCKIWDDTGNLIRDFKPCTYRGEIGLWDMVESKFYGNSGTGKFTAGPSV